MEKQKEFVGKVWNEFSQHKNHLIGSGEFNLEAKGSDFDIDKEEDICIGGKPFLESVDSTMDDKYINRVVPLNDATDVLVIDTNKIESFDKLLRSGVPGNGKNLNVRIVKGETIDHPKHYNNYSVEVIDMMEKIYGIDKLITFCELNAFKYRMRAGTKNSLEEDLAKEKWYLDKVKELNSKL